MTSPGPFRAQFDAAISAASLQVTKENVLIFRDTIYREADRLDQDLRNHGEHASVLPRLGGDPVSDDASHAFPARIKSLLDQCQQYNDDLRGAAAALDHTARSYGLTEEDIANKLHVSASTTVPQASDTDRGRVAVPASPPPPAAQGDPRTQILAPGPGSISRVLSPDAGAI